MDYKRPTQHRMTRRAAAHDYSRPGIYHITIHVADGLGAPLGTVVGSLAATDGTPDAPHTALTPVGAMVEHELLTAITARYPMITIQDYVIMPEHLHFLMVVQSRIISNNGKTQTLGQIIAGFKQGCNRRYWDLLERQAKPAATLTTNTIPPAAPAASTIPPAASTIPSATSTIPPATSTIPPAAPATSTIHPVALSANTLPPATATIPPAAPATTHSMAAPATAAVSVHSGFAAVQRHPLFAPGYCDVMPVDAAQLETQRTYIKGNPRSRLLRTSNRAWLMPRRASITSALTPSALRRYLQRECPSHLATPEALAAIEARLLIAAPGTTPSPYTPTPYATPALAPATSNLAPSTTSPIPPSSPSATNPLPPSSPSAVSVSGGFAAGNQAHRPLIACDTYGNTALITARPCLPVVCHHRDAALFPRQKARCLEEAAHGTTLISARIAKGEQDILDEAQSRGYPVALITDNGLPDRYHPSADRLALCAEGRLLIITPWHYHYRADDATISVPHCKTMNCLAQALCHTKDTWWQTPNKYIHRQ